MKKDSAATKLRPFPYQIIAYLEDKEPGEMPLHCTLLKRFALTNNGTLNEIATTLQAIIMKYNSIQITLGKQAAWSADGTHYTVSHTSQLTALKQEIDSSIKEGVRLRDPQYDNLDSLHVSFDTPGKQTLFGAKNYKITSVGIQVDYQNKESDVFVSFDVA